MSEGPSVLEYRRRPLHDAAVSAAGFEDFYVTQRDGLFGALVLITGSRFEAEDIAQDAFIAVWQRWSQVSTMENPTGYLYRTAMNVFRKRRRRAAVAVRRALGRATPPDVFADVEARDEVDRALARLSPRQRAALVLTELLGFTSEEAGQALGIAASTVRALASQGREASRKNQR